MRKRPIQKRDLAAATRGLIVQRVLVDGWTPDEAGAPFGVDGQNVARWVTAYRRHGMAALRDGNAVEGGLRRWIASVLGWSGTWPRGDTGGKYPDSGPENRGGDSTRRWN